MLPSNGRSGGQFVHGVGGTGCGGLGMAFAFTANKISR